MKRLHKAIISFGIVAVLVAGSSSAFGKSESQRTRSISGAIVSIDRTTRTITVRQHTTGKDINVVVPTDALVRTNASGLRVAAFEQLMVGVFVQDVIVR